MRPRPGCGKRSPTRCAGAGSGTSGSVWTRGDGAGARRAPDVGAGAIQVAYDRLNRVAEEAVLATAMVLAREPLANGYLSGKYRPGSRDPDPGEWRSSHDAQEAQAKLDTVDRIQPARCRPACRSRPGRLCGVCSTPP